MKCKYLCEDGRCKHLHLDCNDMRDSFACKAVSEYADRQEHDEYCRNNLVAVSCKVVLVNKVKGNSDTDELYKFLEEHNNTLVYICNRKYIKSLRLNNPLVYLLFGRHLNSSQDWGTPCGSLTFTFEEYKPEYEEDNLTVHAFDWWFMFFIFFRKLDFGIKISTTSTILDCKALKYQGRLSNIKHSLEMINGSCKNITRDYPLCICAKYKTDNWYDRVNVSKPSLNKIIDKKHIKGVKETPVDRAWYEMYTFGINRFGNGTLRPLLGDLKTKPLLIWGNNKCIKADYVHRDELGNNIREVIYRTSTQNGVIGLFTERGNCITFPMELLRLSSDINLRLTDIKDKVYFYPAVNVITEALAPWGNMYGKITKERNKFLEHFDSFETLEIRHISFVFSSDVICIVSKIDDKTYYYPLFLFKNVNTANLFKYVNTCIKSLILGEFEMTGCDFWNDLGILPNNTDYAISVKDLQALPFEDNRRKTITMLN